VPVRPIDNVDEVPDAALVEEAVVEISADTGCKKTKSDIHHFLFEPAEEEKSNNYHKSNGRKCNQDGCIT